MASKPLVADARTWAPVTCPTRDDRARSGARWRAVRRRLSTWTSRNRVESTSRSRQTIGKPSFANVSVGRVQAEPSTRAVDLWRAEGRGTALRALLTFCRAEEHRVALAQRVLLDAADERCIRRDSRCRAAAGNRLGRLRDEAARDRRPVAGLLDGASIVARVEGAVEAGAVEGA